MMKAAFRSFAFVFLTLALGLSVSASLVPVERSRVHSTSGALGCTVSGATVATPSVITCAATHNLADGDQVQITGIVGTTADNVTGYAKVTGYSATTFGLFSDAALTTGVTGVGTYSSGGQVTQALDVSSYWSGSWTVRVRVDQLTAGKRLLASLQDSADGFVSDIRTLTVMNLTGSSPAGCTGAFCGSYNEYVFRGERLFPSARVGVANGRLRLYVQALDLGGTAVMSWYFEQ